MHLVETDPPEGEKPVQWSLLTSLEVSSAEQAEEVVEHYLQRWRIFRVLKSGCGAQRLRFRTAVRLQRAIAVRSVIAWRLMVLTLLGREVPALEAELLFTAAELVPATKPLIRATQPVSGPSFCGAFRRNWALNLVLFPVLKSIWPGIPSRPALLPADS